MFFYVFSNALQPFMSLVYHLSVYLFISFSLCPYMIYFLHFHYIHVHIPSFFSSAAVSLQPLARYTTVTVSHVVTLVLSCQVLVHRNPNNATARSPTSYFVTKPLLTTTSMPMLMQQQFVVTQRCTILKQT